MMRTSHSALPSGWRPRTVITQVKKIIPVKNQSTTVNDQSTHLKKIEEVKVPEEVNRSNSATWMENEAIKQFMNQELQLLKNELKSRHISHRKQIDELEERIKHLENNHDMEQKTTKPTSQTKVTAVPTIEMNLSGNIPQESNPRTTQQPLDFTKVFTARRRQQPKQELSVSTHQEVENKLTEHNKEIKQKVMDQEIKMKKPTKITENQREKIVEIFFSLKTGKHYRNCSP